MTDDRFFDAPQRAVVEAALARMIPGDHEPGAREAGVIEFVERYLSGIGYLYAKPDGGGFEAPVGRAAQAWRQRIEILRRTYVAGIAALDALSRERFGSPFVALDEALQDEALRALEGRHNSLGEAPPLQQTPAETDLAFVPLLALHARQGFYADPIYGGNRDRVGWKVIGFPGPASLMEVFTGRYSTLPWFAEGEAEKYEEANRGG